MFENYYDFSKDVTNTLDYINRRKDIEFEKQRQGLEDSVRLATLKMQMGRYQREEREDMRKDKLRDTLAAAMGEVPTTKTVTEDVLREVNTSYDESPYSGALSLGTGVEKTGTLSKVVPLSPGERMEAVAARLTPELYKAGEINAGLQLEQGARLERSAEMERERNEAVTILNITNALVAAKKQGLNVEALSAKIPYLQKNGIKVKDLIPTERGIIAKTVSTQDGTQYDLLIDQDTGQTHLLNPSTQSKQAAKANIEAKEAEIAFKEAKADVALKLAEIRGTVAELQMQKLALEKAKLEGKDVSEETKTVDASIKKVRANIIDLKTGKFKGQKAYESKVDWHHVLTKEKIMSTVPTKELQALEDELQALQSEKESIKGESTSSKKGGVSAAEWVAAGNYVKEDKDYYYFYDKNKKPVGKQLKSSVTTSGKKGSGGGGF